MSHDRVAVIVFTDIVTFSQYTSVRQQSIITSLNAELSRELFPLLGRIGADPPLICLPTGDGVALVFVGRCDARVLMSLLHCLIHWTEAVTQLEGMRDACRIRVGVHTGSVSVIPDLNRLPNVCGDDINLCQRIMDQARPNQVLFSEAAYDWYFRRDTTHSSFPFTRERPAEFSPLPHRLTVKHDRSVDVRYMFVRDDPLWSAESPMSVPMVIEGRGAAARRTKRINELLAEAATGNRKEVQVCEQASFSTFSITDRTEFEYDRELADLCVAQRTRLEKLMQKKKTDVRVLLRNIPAKKTPWPGVNNRLTALAAWMDANLVGDVYRPADTGVPTASTVQFRVAEGEGWEFWRTGGPNVFMIPNLVRIDGYRIRENVSLGLNLVYYEEHKILEAMKEFNRAFTEANGQSNAVIRKRLKPFHPLPK